MQSSDILDESPIVKELSNVASQAFHELEITKQSLKEKELELIEIAEISNQKIHAAVKTNQDLQNKVQILMDFSNTLETKNKELEQKNNELAIRENTYNKLNHELKEQLLNVSKTEKDLELRKKYLEKQVELKTDALIKSQKMAIIGELTSRLAHDLRNPLSVIKTAHGIMKEKPKMDVKQRLEYNARIDRALLRIIHLVNDVLGFVRITDLDLNETSVRSLIDSAIDSIDVPKQIEIIKPTDDFKINCDFRKLEAVFANLLTNSIQAIEKEGKIELRLSSDNDSIKLEIEDTGSGIPKSIMPKIFDPLFTTKANGTGLGLAICKTIIEQHGGTITVKSNPTTFTIILPKNQ
ncbi:MAG: histidine kinase [Thaumarchaeota archaeon CSP1-1]|nr:MAG: histidine kinase [Thaumarchaeota archaeon CSP1-1]